MISFSLKQKKAAIAFLLFLIDILLVLYFHAPFSKKEIVAKSFSKPKGSVFQLMFSLYGASDGKSKVFKKPYDIALDDKGNIYITDIEAHCIYIFTREGRFIRVFGEYGVANPPKGIKATWKEGSLAYPTGIDVDSEGKIYVVDSGNRRVNVYNSEGRFLYYFPKGFELENPLMLKVKGGEVYISDRGGIKVFSKRGEFKRVIGKDELVNPAGLALDREGKIYVAEPLLSKVFCFSPRGAILWERGGKESEEFGIPFGIAIDKAARLIFVTDAFRHQVVTYTLEGEKPETGVLTKDVGGFSFPRGACFSPNGVLYIADSNNRRVQAFKVDVKGLLNPEMFITR